MGLGGGGRGENRCDLGIRPGAVYGKSDRKGAFVTTDPVSPKDLLATVYHLCGVGPDTMIRPFTTRISTVWQVVSPTRVLSSPPPTT